MLTSPDHTNTFFSPAEFGEEAVYQTGTEEHSITILFDEDYLQVEADSEESYRVNPVASALQTVCTVRESEVPTPKRGETIVIRGVAYEIVTPRPDGAGLIEILLMRS